MLTYYLPDLSGNSPEYLKENRPFFFWKAAIKIEFQSSPIFLDSLKITTTDGLSTPLVYGVDYVVGDDDIDSTAMSIARGENPEFSKVLVKSITMKSAKGLNQRLSMSYQEFYLTTANMVADDGRPIEITPDLIKFLINDQAALRQQISRVLSPVVPNNRLPKLLALDINKERNANKVTGEIAQVNTVIGQKVIRPIQGLFFADSVKITVGQTVLNKNTDYLSIDLSPLTKQSTNVSGIYRYIVLLKPVTGEISLDYHAVGGEIQPDDLQKSLDIVLAIRTFLDESVFVTPDTVIDTPAVRAAFARLAVLENKVRILSSGSPTYEDSTSGLAILRPVRATNASFHWYTIASLYQVAGSSDVISADQFKGRVFFPGLKVTLAFTVDVNFNQSRNPVSFETDAVIFDPTYTLFGDVSVNAPVYPLVRVVWDQSGQTLAGALIQIGVPIPDLEDVMVVEDLSTSESGWILNQANRRTPGGPAVSPSGPSDNGITLPDGVTVWTSGNSSAKSRTFVPEYSKGYLVWTGSTVTVDNVNTTSSTESNFTVRLPSYVPLSSLSEFVITLTNADGGSPYDVVIPMHNQGVAARTGRASFVSNTDVTTSLIATLRLDNTNTLRLNLQAKNGSGVPDQIRYVRVRP